MMGVAFSRCSRHDPETLNVKRQGSGSLLQFCCNRPGEKLTGLGKPHKIRDAEVVEQADAPDSKL
jgi:ribonucleotide monophosphatase NagD (HAD superfamily)